MKPISEPELAFTAANMLQNPELYLQEFANLFEALRSKYDITTSDLCRCCRTDLAELAKMLLKKFPSNSNEALAKKLARGLFNDLQETKKPQLN